MKTKIALTIAILLAYISMYAQNYHRYPFISGVVEYQLNGSTTGKQITYWDEYGNKEATFISSETKLFGRISKTTKSIVTHGDVVFEWTDDDNNIYKTDNPFFAFCNEGNLYNLSALELSEKYMQLQGFIKIGEEDILGKNCIVYNGLGKYWIWNGLLLKTEVKVLKQTDIAIATKIRTNIAVSPSIFNLPQNRIFIDNSNYGKKTEELIKQPKTLGNNNIEKELNTLFN